MKNTDILTALTPFINALQENNISYYIGGSIASSMYGAARATRDVDIIADIRFENIPALKKALDKEFYIDTDMIKDAIARQSSFNLIHLDSAIKVDVFIPKYNAFQQSVFQRKIQDFLEGTPDEKFYFSSAEDTILSRLLWYESGHRVSKQQWSDVIGIIKIQDNNLDKDYIKNWAIKLKIANLVMKAFDDAGIKF